MRQYPRRSRSVARQNPGIEKTRNRKTMRESSMDDGARKLRRTGSIKKIGF